MDLFAEGKVKRFFRAKKKLKGAGLVSHTRLPSPVFSI